MTATNNDTGKRLPVGLHLMTALPVAALLLALKVLMVPLKVTPNDPTVLDQAFNCLAALLFLSIPIIYLGYGVAALLSSEARRKMHAHRCLVGIWTFTFVLFLFGCVVSGHGDPNSKIQRTARTNMELSQIKTGILAYENEYGTTLPSTVNHDPIATLKGSNLRKIPFVGFSHWQLDAYGEAVDAWGTPLRFSFPDQNNALVQSAGPDRVWGTKDDITAQ